LDKLKSIEEEDVVAIGEVATEEEVEIETIITATTQNENQLKLKTK
jgi:hypothetical protein